MNSRRVPGIIDSLTTGFSLVFRRPYLILVPFLVDLLVSAGPGLSVGPLVQAAVARIMSALASGPLSPDQLLDINAQVTQATDAVASWNLLGILGWQVPNLLGLGTVDISGPHVVVASYTGLVPLLLGLALGGVLIACLFLGPLGQVVRARGLHLPSLAPKLTGLWLRLTGYLGLVIVLAFALGTAALLVTALVTAISPVVASLVVLLAIGGGILAAIYLFLGDEAVVVGDAGPVRAIKESVSIALRHFWSVVGLFLLVNLLSQGLGLVWRHLGSGQAGLWIAMAGNAFVATGLVASVMVYYWGRRPIVSEPALSPIRNPGLSASKRDG